MVVVSWNASSQQLWECTTHAAPCQLGAMEGKRKECESGTSSNYGGLSGSSNVDKAPPRASTPPDSFYLTASQWCGSLLKNTSCVKFNHPTKSKAFPHGPVPFNFLKKVFIQYSLHLASSVLNKIRHQACALPPTFLESSAGKSSNSLSF